MAHFAKLIGNKVTEVITVHNNELLVNGVESEEKGIQFLKSIYGENTNWKQTSYSGSFRKNYAGVGSTYDQERNAFIAPKPYNSWVLNESTCQWEAPVQPRPANTKWNEETLSWVPKNS